jgi:N-acetylmuramoyl-L-alanine amidase
VITAALLLATAGVAAGPELAKLPDGSRVEWRRGEAPVVLVTPKRGEGWLALATRVTGNAHLANELRVANGQAGQPLYRIPVRVPWQFVRPEMRVAAARALFSDDRRTAAGWEHVIVAPWGGDGESWWELAEWFTGDGANYPRLREANPDVELFPPKGVRIVIPVSVLRAEFRAAGIEARPAAPAPTPARTAKPGPRPTAPVAAARAGEGALLYGEEEAIYRLRPGEALYSAVVVRFTGQLHASDVNATAAEIARRSSIGDVAAIPVGYPVRIPFDMLLPEYLPPGHPRRVAWEEEREQLAGIKRIIRAANLDGIHVILDAGHGGADTGAIAGQAWESTYAYDVMLRVKRVLEQETRATVWTTIQDPERTSREAEEDVLPARRSQRLLVDPPYGLGDPVVGVTLRWVLADSILARLQRRKVDSERVVFVSIHADSLHPSVRGLMVYVPARSLRPTRAPWPAGLPDCREVRSFRPPSFPARFRSRAEALSGQLGEALVHAARLAGVAVHAYEPVRSSVMRGGSRWVPAVLRYSSVPSAVLVEICNLNNEQDHALLLTRRFREQLAHAIAAGLAEGFTR